MEAERSEKLFQPSVERAVRVRADRQLEFTKTLPICAHGFRAR